MELDGSGNPLAVNTRGDWLISRLLPDGRQAWYLYNGHGDVAALVDNGGAALTNYAYDPFGNLTTSAGVFNNPYLYAGEPYDTETQNYYLRARYYSPALGRFITEDAYPGNINEPLTLNHYTYALNNPLVYIDPSGNISLKLWEKKARDQWTAAGKGLWDFTGETAEGLGRLASGTLNGAAEFASDPVGQTQQVVDEGMVLLSIINNLVDLVLVYCH